MSLVQPVHADQVRLNLSSVRVDQQREASGDRPYFASVQFRSQICQRGTTSASLIEREPHDWVSQPELNGGLPSGHHMLTGQSLAIPSWQGSFVWDGVTMVPAILANGAPNNDVAKAEILGALIVSFDNNNTPPHVIRDNMNRVRELTRKFLMQKVESCSIIGGIHADEIGKSIPLMAGQLWSISNLVELLAQMTVGSTFNPDQPTGIHLVLMPAISGFRGVPVEPQLVGTALPAGPIEFRQSIMAPETRSSVMDWVGSGARYSTPFSVQLTPVSAPPASSIVDELRLRIRTGGDDLRGGSDNLMGSVQISGRWSPEFILNSGSARWPDNSIRNVVIPLPSGTRLSELQKLRLRTTFSGGIGGDNWNMDSLRIEWHSQGRNGFLAERNGGPAKRFTAESQEFVVKLR